MAAGITVIIKNYFGTEYLPACLDSLLAQEPVTPEIFVIDAISNENNLAALRRSYPSVSFIRPDKTAGPAGTEARGIAAATRPNIVLLNSDTIVGPDWILGISAYMAGLPAPENGLPKVIYHLDENIVQTTGGAVASEKNTLSWLQTENARVKEQLKEAETRHQRGLERVSKLQETIAKLQAKNKNVSKLTYENALNEGMVQNLEQQVESLKLELHNSEALIRKAEKQLHEKEALEIKLKTANDELEKANRRIQNLHKVVEELKIRGESTSDETENISALKARISELEFIIEESQKEFSEALLEKNSEIEKALDRVAELMVKSSKRKTDIDNMSAAAAENNSLKMRIARLDAELAKTRSELKNITAEKERIVSESSNLVAELVENISHLSMEKRNAGWGDSEIEDFKQIAMMLEERLAETEDRFEEIIREKDRALEEAEEKIRRLESDAEDEGSGSGSAGSDGEGSEDTSEPGDNTGDVSQNKSAVPGKTIFRHISISKSNSIEQLINDRRDSQSFDNDTTQSGAEPDEASLIRNICENPSPAAFLQFREFFMEKSAFEDGIRVLTDMFARQAGEKVIPAISLLVGEFYDRAGRSEEAEYFLSNPMIPRDSISAELLRQIHIELPGGAASRPADFNA